MGSVIHLIKLYGSLNWAKFDKYKSIISWYLKDFFNKYRYRFLKNGMKVIIDLPSKLIGGEFEHCGEKISRYSLTPSDSFFLLLL